MTNPRWLSVLKIGFDIFIAKSKARTDRCVDVVRIHGIHELGNNNGVFKHVEVRNFAFDVAAAPCRILKPSPRFRPNVGV